MHEKILNQDVNNEVDHTRTSRIPSSNQLYCVPRIVLAAGHTKGQFTEDRVSEELHLRIASRHENLHRKPALLSIIVSLRD